MAARLYIFPDRILWASPGFVGQDTQRPAPALLLGVNRPLSVTLADGQQYRGRALLVQAQVMRRVDAQDAGFCSLNLDPSHAWAGQMRIAGDGRPVRVLDGKGDEAWLRHARLWLQAHPDCAAAHVATEALLREFWPAPEAQTDPRIQKVTAHLQNNLPARLALDELAAAVALSPSRLRHLFREQTGVPLRSYLLWLKMQQAAALFSRDWSMTAVAAEIGFSDAPHLCRVFREYFSVNPSWLADTDQVRVCDCR